MNKERLYQVVRFPHVSEKTARLQADSNQYVFEVRRDATKEEIRSAVEGLFDVKVENVQVLNQKGKRKTFRFRPGVQKSWKKAYVRVAEGQTIEDLQAD
ncbi:50S ribosomal protein L23 [Wenzhouxiangella marina]|uniref:Large ribosomal subunit protein uL23 n=1 Tax=Wenzhouxiangella marina TaxID=1579979 RepID=A0A0K0XYA6_9GAMM|nr:50S ribosomal protein L23 [Wenzhouxiangella marina]AKS42650.1 50S ribosomal protein L23 [Wenzhouxiangella marina]MBB6085568.1 large subunit ribosomal protein L23 [Wenzhouxiangella marina]